jgi:hypothetical protein
MQAKGSQHSIEAVEQALCAWRGEAARKVPGTYRGTGAGRTGACGMQSQFRLDVAACWAYCGK